MAEDKSKDVRSEGSIDEKPCFSTSDIKILMNLHKAALQKTADVARKYFHIEDVGDVLYNGMLSEDGKTISSKSGQYELGFVIQYLDFHKPTEEEIKKNDNDFSKAFVETNKEGLNKLKNNAFEVLQAYIKAFADTEPSIEKMVDFIPDYNGKRVTIKGGKIISMDEKNRVKYLQNHSEKDQPRLGFKFGFTYKS